MYLGNIVANITKHNRDSAKKEFDIKSVDELTKIKKKWIRKDNEGRVIKPFFFGFLAKEKGFYNSQKKNYMHHDTSMDYLHKIVNGCRMPKSDPTITSIDEIIDTSSYDYNKVRRDNVRKILAMLEDFLSYSNYLFKDHECGDKYKEYMDTKKWLYTEINKLTINTDTLIALYRKLKKNEVLKKYIMTVFFNIGNNQAFQLIKESAESIPYLIIDKNGEIEIYGAFYSKIFKNPNK